MQNKPTEKVFKIVNPEFSGNPIFASVQEIHKDKLSKSSVEKYVDTSHYCSFIAKNNFNEDIYEDDILVTPDGDICRVWISDAAILVGDIEKKSDSILALEPFLNYRVIGNYNDKRSYILSKEYTEWIVKQRKFEKDMFIFKIKETNQIWLTETEYGFISENLSIIDGKEVGKNSIHFKEKDKIHVAFLDFLDWKEWYIVYFDSKEDKKYLVMIKNVHLNEKFELKKD